MPDIYTILNLDPNATQDEIAAAYNHKHAELISQASVDANMDQQLKQLEDAYAQLSKRSQLAIPQAPPPHIPIDPSLNLVNQFDAPIIDRADPVVIVSCPNCGSPNPSQAMICMACGQQMSRPCPNCGKPVLLTQTVCPRCNALIRETDQFRLAEAIHTNKQIQQERLENQVRVNSLEAAHSERIKNGILFWILVILVVIGLCVFGVFALGLFGVGSVLGTLR
jgi:hypothetical protein